MASRQHGAAGEAARAEARLPRVELLHEQGQRVDPRRIGEHERGQVVAVRRHPRLALLVAHLQQVRALPQQAERRGADQGDAAELRPRLRRDMARDQRAEGEAGEVVGRAVAAQHGASPARTTAAIGAGLSPRGGMAESPRPGRSGQNSRRSAESRSMLRTQWRQDPEPPWNSTRGGRRSDAAAAGGRPPLAPNHGAVAAGRLMPPRPRLPCAPARLPADPDDGGGSVVHSPSRLVKLALPKPVPMVNTAQWRTSRIQGAWLSPCTTASLWTTTTVSRPPIRGKPVADAVAAG